MVGTIETTNNNIIIKIKSIFTILDLFQRNLIIYDKMLYDTIVEIEDDYTMGSVNVLSDYFLAYNKYKNATDTKEKQDLIKEKDLHFTIYQYFIHKENFISKLDILIKSIKKYISRIKSATRCILKRT